MNCSIAYIGPGIVSAASERDISLYTTTSLSYYADAASYSPSCGFMVNLLTGGSVRQLIATLTELDQYVVSASQQAISRF